MAETESPNPAPAPDAPVKVVKIGRATIALNVLTQLLVVVALIAMVNYLGFRHYKRWDFSRDKKYALSSQTQALLGSLPKPVKAVLFFSGAAEIYPDVQALLREYEYASKGQFSSEVVDPYRNITRAQDLQTKYKFGASENILILDYDGRSKFVNGTEMAEIEQPDQMAQMVGQGPKLKAFKGEQAITTALMELVENKPNKVYYLTGHGETELEGEGMKVFNESLKRQNVQIAALTLLNENAIPEDARALVLNAPKYDLSDLEMELLGSYFVKHGRLYVMLNPTAKTPRLNAWLAQRGIIPRNDRVIAIKQMLVKAADGSVDVQKGPNVNPDYTVLDSQTKLTKDLEGVGAQFLGLTQSLAFDRTKEQTDKMRLTALIQAAEGYWGETEFVSDTATPAFDPNKDYGPPLTLAAAAEKGAVADSRVKVETSRLVVVGNGESLSDKSYRQSEGLSNDFTVNVLNWLLDREEMIGIAAKEKKQTTMSLNEHEMNRLKTFVLLLVPGLAAVCGLANWWVRRS
jgi:ABC-type uncharacterized transport system